MIFSLPKIHLPKWQDFVEKCINRVSTKNGVTMLPLEMIQDVSEKILFFSKKLGLDVFDASFRVNSRSIAIILSMTITLASAIRLSQWSEDITVSNLAIVHIFLYSQVRYTGYRLTVFSF